MFDRFQRWMRQAGKRRGVSRRRKPKVLGAEPLEARQLLAADTISSLIPSIGATATVAVSGGADAALGGDGTTTASLSATDFTYLGAARLPINQTGWEEGLAYRASTDTFFTIGNAGRVPFDLEEIKIPAAGGKATLVKDWGPIDPTGILGETGAMVRMKGLAWDQNTGQLWISWGSYYNADHSNDECLAYVTFGGGELQLHGPWSVSTNVGSDNVRGEIALAPPELQAITGQKFISFAGRGSTGQDESWGPSLASFANPTAIHAGGQTSAEELTHWPMQSKANAAPKRGSVRNFYSAFPRMADDSVVRITGNNNVIPGVRDSYQYNLQVTDKSFADGDGIAVGAWIQVPGIDGLVYFGRESEGYAWYGNASAHDDKSAAGAYYGNNLGIVDTADANRGSHAQKWNWTVDFVSAASVLGTAEKVKAGTATAADLEQQPTSIVEFTSLGGTVPMPRAAAGSIGGVYFDQATGTLYVLEQYGLVLEWHVGAPASVSTTNAAGGLPVSDTPVSVTTLAPPETQQQPVAPVPAAVDLVMAEEADE